jgi:hypothetical protein
LTVSGRFRRVRRRSGCYLSLTGKIPRLRADAESAAWTPRERVSRHACVHTRTIHASFAESTHAMPRRRGFRASSTHRVAINSFR